MWAALAECAGLGLWPREEDEMRRGSGSRGVGNFCAGRESCGEALWVSRGVRGVEEGAWRTGLAGCGCAE